MRTIKEFLIENGILPPEGSSGSPYAKLTDENRHLIEPWAESCESCTILGTVRGDHQAKYVQEVLVLFGSLIEAVAESRYIDDSRGFVLRTAYSLQSIVETDLKIVNGTSWSLRKGFQVVTHLKYPPTEANHCWNDVFFSILGGQHGNPFMDAAQHLAFNKNTELNKFLFG